ncbi:hypothetical protein GCM10025881_34220 [Pseudolysinimonas kribbensis]|uniref:Transcription factor NusA N-terminal domain-containing protein n=1 Tax=Pseudolysinimonas kribbensis TaxID=433641 RepID=A0ABQ6K7I1_9MICO|nr:hypothetical protein GCM10025881_34220 [Pseudolysinimonas kribbensis]
MPRTGSELNIGGPVDIDLTMLRMMEREREIPFDELVTIIEQAILTAYLKHTGTDPESGARVELDRKTGHVTVYVPELDDDGEQIGEAVDNPDDFGRISAFAAKQVINQRLRDIGDDKVLGSSATARATSSPASSSRARTRA